MIIFSEEYFENFNGESIRTKQPLSEDIEFLEHFGKKGMRWGVRNEKRESKAKEFDDKAKSLQSLIDKIDVRVAKNKRASPTTNRLNNKRQILAKRQEILLKDAEAKRQGKLTSGQKKLVGAAVVAGAVAAAIILHKHKDVKIHNLRKSNKEFIAAKDLLDRKLSKRLKDLQDLSRMTSGNHPSRLGALKEIDNLNSFYKIQLGKMATRHNVTEAVLNKMNLGGFG